MTSHGTPGNDTRERGTPAEVFGVFLKLGLTSFGGPIAHLGYFRDELVTRRQWLSDRAYADLVALCQFLPGPASSQAGFALGMMRAGWLGALAAFVAFTLPSALVLLAFAFSARVLTGPVASGALDGLRIVAVAIVAQAVWGMSRSLCPDRPRAAMAIAAVGLMAVFPGTPGMVAGLATGALAGLAFGSGSTQPLDGQVHLPVRPWHGVTALLAFAGLLLALPLLRDISQVIGIIDTFYRSGALVFGGGHVVLPLLQAGTVDPGWVSADDFLAGYGAAQAVPGPLFTFAGYLGAVLGPEPNGLPGAMLALVALFLPGFLILIGVIPFWDRFRALPIARSAMAGANATVVGILGAALYSPVFVGAVHDTRDFFLALVCLAALLVWKAPPWVVVILAAGGGMALSLAG